MARLPAQLCRLRNRVATCRHFSDLVEWAYVRLARRPLVVVPSFDLDAISLAERPYRVTPPLGVGSRCVITFTSFSEFNKAEGGDFRLAIDERRALACVAQRVGRAAIIRPFSFAQRMPFMLTALASSGKPEMCAPNKFLFAIRSLPHLKPHLRSPWSASCIGRLAHRCRTRTLSCAPEPPVPCPAELSPKRSYGWRDHSRDRKVRPYISDRTAHRWSR
jgi:hypothetical protein